MSIDSKLFSKRVAALIMSALLAACGGGSGTGDTTAQENTASGGGGSGIGGSPLLDGGMVGESNIACNTNQGTDNDSEDEDWSNNCYVQVDPTDNGVSETFAESYYAEGIQRVVWCLGHGAEFDRETFIDKEYGPRTKAAVESFQDQEGLVIDGIVGLETWEALQSSLVEVGSDSFSVAWAVADANYTGLDAPTFENDCLDQPVFWEYLSPTESIKAWTLTDRDTEDASDTTTFGRTEETFFGNTF